MHRVARKARHVRRGRTNERRVGVRLSVAALSNVIRKTITFALACVACGAPPRPSSNVAAPAILDAGKPPSDTAKNGLATLAPRQITLASAFHFAFDAPPLAPENLPLLDAVAELLSTHPRVTVEIGCHDDNRGRWDAITRTTQERADALRAYIVDHGIAPARLTSHGYGATRPIADAPREAQRRCLFIRTDE